MTDERGPMETWLNDKIGHLSSVPWPEIGSWLREQDAALAEAQEANKALTIEAAVQDNKIAILTTERDALVAALRRWPHQCTGRPGHWSSDDGGVCRVCQSRAALAEVEGVDSPA